MKHRDTAAGNAQGFARGDGSLGLRPSLGLPQAFVMSLGGIAPVLAVAFSLPLAAQAAGRAAPLTYLLGGCAVVLVALSFTAFARRIADAGSAAAYLTVAFGPRWGFLAGWALLLTYVSGATGLIALTGGFTAAALAHAGLASPGLWLPIALAGAGLTIALCGREVRGLAHVLVAVEVCAALAILALAVAILAHAPLSTAPFSPDPDRGWAGVGRGLTFAVMSFVGFEGAAALGEETHDAYRAVPVALLAAVVAAGALFTVVSYAQALAVGPDRVADLDAWATPLDALATRYVSGGYGVVLDLAAAASAFGCALGVTVAGSRVLYALSRGGFGVRLHLHALDGRRGVPRRAVHVVGGVSLVGLVTLGAGAGEHAYAEATATVGTLTALLVYIAVGLAQAAVSWGERRWTLAGAGALGAAVLIWPLFTSIYPAPAWPANLWPAVVIAWLSVGAALSRDHGFRGMDARTSP